MVYKILQAVYIVADLMTMIGLENTVVKKILDYLGIYEFKRDRPPPKTLAVADSFDDYAQNDYIDCDYSDF